MSNNRINHQQLVEIFKALSNAHRFALFHRLITCCEPGTKCDADKEVRFCVGELGQGLGIAASTLSHHLKELHRAGLVKMERRGKNVECWMDPEILTEVSNFFNPNENT